MTLKVGITGGIGSGKSVVCEIFKCLGVPVFEADIVARNLLNDNPLIKEELIRLFGTSIYSGNNTVDRKKLASIVFNDDFALQKLNSLVHPLVRENFHEWFSRQNSAYVLHEAAILIESGFYKLMDKTILVVAHEETRINRVIKRDKLDREMVLERISKQWDDQQKKGFADEIIDNNNKMLIPQVLNIHEYLTQLTKNKN